MSATAHAVLSLLVATATAPAEPPSEPRSVPPPRVVVTPAAVPVRGQPRPLAVVTLGIGMVALASGLSLVAIGTESRLIASQGRTEGEARARDRGARHLLAVGIPLASVGLATVIGGIVWVVRSRARRSHPRHTASRRDSAEARSFASRSPISMVASSRSGRV